MSLPSQDLLKSLLDYNPHTGELFWKSRPRGMFKTEGSWRSWNTRWANKEAFTYRRSDGYYEGAVRSKLYLAHRVIWKLVMGRDAPLIDHEDGNRSNNRLRNLRGVNPQGNNQNQKRPISNKSGVVGVIWYKQTSRWKAQIAVGHRSIHLGYFCSFDEAVLARKTAEQKYGFHPNHGRVAC